MMRVISSHSAPVRWSAQMIAGRTTAPASSSSTAPCIWPEIASPRTAPAA
jgi:hypothetical protein